MADKRISQLIERTNIANNDVLPIVASGATTTNKVTVSTLQDWMQDNLDVGVTSVGITIGSTGTDVNVTGSPVTSSGNITINIPTASATNRGLLSSADWSTFNNKVSSVGLSMPSAFAVANSPITGSGTIAVTGAGTVAQYIRGDGSLADFPSGGGGGGSSVNYYLNGSVSQGTIGGIAYREMNKVPILGAGTDFTIAADGYIASFITDAGDPALLEIPAGNWNFESYFSASSGGGSPSFYIELYKVNSGGTASLIASSSATPELISFGTSISPYFSPLAVPATVLTVTDRLAVRYYVTHSGRTITLHTENSHLCQIITTFTTGLTALNGLTAQVQNFATGTSGTDFAISSSVSTHTFNLPDASATARGVVTTGSQTFAGAKTFNSSVTANSLIKTGGTSSQFLKADGSVDSSTYYLASNPSGFTTNLGTVTSVAALTLGTSGTDLSSTVANGTTTPVITLNVPDASASARGVVTTGTQTIAGAKTLTSPLNGTTSIFSSAFASNQTSKVGIGFEEGYGLINAWGADASTYAGLKFQVSESDGNTYDAIRINPDGTLYVPAGGYISILQAASLRVGAANAQSQALTPPVAKFINSANNFVKIALGQGETAPNFNDYYGIIALDNNVNLDDNKLRFYLGYDDAVNSHDNDQLVIQGDGNVGIGTATPSAKLHVTGTSLITGAATFSSSVSVNGAASTTSFNVQGSGANGILIDQNSADAASSSRLFFKMNTQTYAMLADANGLNFMTGATAGSSSGSPKVTITSGGNVGIGTGSPSGKLEVVPPNAGGNEGIFVNQLGSSQATIRFKSAHDANSDYRIGASILVGSAFEIYSVNAATTRFAVTSGGYTKVSNNGSYYAVAANFHELRNTINDNEIVNITHAGSSPYGISLYYTTASPNNSSNWFLYCSDSTAQRMSIRSNGGIYNFQANDVNLSDERVKKEIEPLESYWDKFKAIEIVKFKYKDQTHDDFNIGVIAQQVEAVAPEFVDVDGWGKKPELDEEGNEIVSEEEPLKAIYTADLYHATIKVLQEAMAKIEKLETEIDSLKNQIK